MRTIPRALIVALAAGAAASTALSCDEDWRKLRDRRDPIVGPVMSRIDFEEAAKNGNGQLRGQFDSVGVVLRSWIPLNNFPNGNTSGADCWGYTSASGREYALIGLEKGISVVEVTNPDAPVQIGFVVGSTSLWHDVTVIGNYAYAVSDSTGPGIQVINLQNVDSGSVSLVATRRPGGISTVHTLLSNPASNRLFACGSNISNGGMVVMSVASDATNPVIQGAWTTQYVHECQVVTHTSGPFAGQEIAYLFAAGPFYGYTNGLATARVNADGTVSNLKLMNYPGIQFCHQGWITPDYQYLFVNDELDEGNTIGVTTSRLFDVSDVANPVFVKTFTNNETSIDHNMYVVGDKLFEGNYTTGLRVFDIADPVNPREVAYIDTYPESDGASFNGVWGNYPFFASGNIILSDLERGMFVVSLDIGRVAIELPNGAPDTLQPGQATEIVATAQGADGRELEPGTVTLHYSVNGGSFASIPMADQGGGEFSASLPAGQCFDEYDYYVSADSTDGNTYTNPNNAPSQTYSATVVTGSTSLFADNFETNLGWTVENVSLTDGAWERGIPAGDGSRGDPTADADGSGRCYLTANRAGNSDVDGGPTRLVSPAMDLSAASGGAELTFAVWFSTDDGNDFFTVDLSSNNGGSWTNALTLGSTGGWQSVTLSVGDYITPSAQTKVRFVTSDNPNDSVTEAAIDAVSVVALECEAPCAADLDGNGTLNVFDFLLFQTAFSNNDPIADVAPPFGVWNVFDFLAYQTLFGTGC